MEGACEKTLNYPAHSQAPSGNDPHNSNSQSPPIAQETFTRHKVISIPTWLQERLQRYGNGCCHGFPPWFPYPRASRCSRRPTTNGAFPFRYLAFILLCVYYTTDRFFCQDRFLFFGLSNLNSAGAEQQTQNQNGDFRRGADPLAMAGVKRFRGLPDF